MIILHTIGQEAEPPTFVIDIITDAEENARIQAVTEAGERNQRWLATQWDRLLPTALGKYVAVADQEAHIAETSEEAWAWVRANHPSDPGPYVKYVLPHQEPRIYANRG